MCLGRGKWPALAGGRAGKARWQEFARDPGSPAQDAMLCPTEQSDFHEFHRGVAGEGQAGREISP